MTPELRQELRQLRHDLLSAHRRTGELLMTIKQQPKLNFTTMLKLHAISLHDADQCMELCTNWEQVQQAVAWCVTEGWRTPATPEQALCLLPSWRQAKLH